SVTSGSSVTACPASTMACAIGCSEPNSTAAAVISTCSSDQSLSEATSETVILPSVIVPVLSKTTVSTPRESSNTCGPLIKMPNWEARPVPASKPTGVAKPNAHGHAIISTVTAARNAVAGSPKMSHAANVINAMTNTMGTNTAEIR